MGKINFPLPSPRDQIALTARDLIAETFQPYVSVAGQTPASQSIYYSLVGLRAGDVVTNILVSVNTVATGTDPTAVYLGLYSSAGARLGLTADLKTDAKWDTAGAKEFALTAPYTVTADGGYYCAFLLDGAWGTQNLQLNRAAGNTSTQLAISGGVVPYAIQASQSSLPETATLAATSNPLWFGVN